jgi:cysteine synthase
MQWTSEQGKLLRTYPLLGTIGHTPLVRVSVLEQQFHEVEVYAKLEYFSPGGSLKDLPVRQILLDALSRGALHAG